MGTGRDAKDGPAAGTTPDSLSREAVEWGFRLLAGRDALSREEFAAFQALPDLDAMRRAFTNTTSFHAFFDAVLTVVPHWTMPLFLLRPPQVEGLDWRFDAPDLEQPGCQLCTRSQFKDAAFAEIAGAMGLRSGTARSAWEQVWVAAVLATEGMIAPGRRLLAIEAGRERIAALVASRGADVVATGPAMPTPADAELRRTQMFYPEVVHIEEFDRRVGVTALDPTALFTLPPGSFDACWSFGMPSRLGSVDAALAFFEASLGPLRPGGIALHCFDFNLTSDARTWDLPDLVILRRRDIETLARHLHEGGHRLLPLNTHPGADPADEQVTTEPGSTPGHRQRHGFVVSTSFGLAIRKAA
jgi:hypothetical protein